MNDPITKQDDPRPERIRRMKQHIQSNNRLSKVLRETREQLKSALAELAALKARAAEDTRRLDWLEYFIDAGMKNGLKTEILRDSTKSKTLRETIDIRLDALRKENPSDALER